MDKGAHFYNCDFQVHTPRDLNWRWRSNKSFEKSGCVTDTDRKNYAKSLISACREKKLDAIAITDHHDFAFFKYVKSAAMEEKNEKGKIILKKSQIVVFPGIEVTINICQLLLIFDADFSTKNLELITGLLNITVSNVSAASTAKTVNLNYNSVDDFKKQLDINDKVKGRYIILPNLNECSRHSLLCSSYKSQVSSMHCVGGYLDGSFSKLPEGTQNIIKGKNVEYGNRNLAYFQTSDNRMDDHAKLGTHTSWVKWSEPTAEALRQACLAKESRISHTPPKLPELTIKRVKISNSTFLGSINLELNGQFNAFIGGRGTGKSTVFEYIRWCLCNNEEGNFSEYQNRSNRLIEATLKIVKGEVSVEFDLDNIPHIIKRSSGNNDLTLKIASGKYNTITIDEVRKRFNIQAYSQKEISDLSNKSSSLLRFIETPIKKELEQIDQEMSMLETSIRGAYRSKIKLEYIQHQIDINQNNLFSAQKRLKSKSMEMVDISESDKNLLQQKNMYDEMSLYIKTLSNNKNKLIEDLMSVKYSLLKFNIAPASNLIITNLDPEFIQNIHKTMVMVVGDCSQNILNSIDKINDEFKKIENVEIHKFSEVQIQYQKEYNGVFNRQSAHKTVLHRVNELNEYIRSYKENIKSLTAQKKITILDAKHYDDFKEKWLKIINVRDNMLLKQCKKLTKESDKSIKAKLIKDNNVIKFCNLLQEALQGSNIRSDRIYDVQLWLTDNLKKDDKSLDYVLFELEMLARNKTFDMTEILPNTPLLIKAGLKEVHLKRISDHLTSEKWLDLSLFPVTCEPCFQYIINKRNHIPFENASAGQQATAILKTLLNQAGPPLFIDQPEEDLDNSIIQDIVSILWEAKKIRQIIFVSHNPNLVVNGDAELVICFENQTEGDLSKGHIIAEGAIDISDVKQKIQSVMEGGREAFALRQKKYDF